MFYEVSNRARLVLFREEFAFLRSLWGKNRPLWISEAAFVISFFYAAFVSRCSGAAFLGLPEAGI